MLTSSGISSYSNGPAAKPACNHSHIESLTLSPNSNAYGALLDFVGSQNLPLHQRVLQILDRNTPLQAIHDLQIQHLWPIFEKDRS